MIRGTHNETIKTVSRSIIGESFEVVKGSPDGILPAITTELREIDIAGLDPANTFTIIPSNEHNPL